MREDPDEIAPYWLAARTIAFATETSWSEKFVLIWLPIQRAEQYYHALLKRAGYRTYAPKRDRGFHPEAPEEAADLAPLEDDAELTEAMRRFNIDTATS